ncbi:hypothetical protein CNMCM8980_007375 [Aspergillus fumigatiaffinis]|uniref:Phytase-like domain-containing protein n=1 Tax=Aspergillus fumigatiaffinis TaxID=340414 RepID=A0A8H4GP86_9EURO|nr:hypothetical protein CNMCM6805_006369 [Aspergillus fumigatiaffinis]KAF4227413.1 hypothetical protein CNMCM8980_007375 [Aspergillus fumigatiaffinis]
MGPDEVPTTGLDPDASGFIQIDGFPPLPRATYKGDGFGGAGETYTRIALDCEGLVLGPDRSFWISDEYGPYIYQFSEQGKMIRAIQPPPAFLPLRNGTFSFSSAEPPIFERDRLPFPTNPTAGRANNQGFEGLTMSSDGKSIYAMMQSAMNQEGGPKKKFRRQARLLEYDISGQQPALLHEFIVTLPLYDDGNDIEAATQSEIHKLPNGQFLILARDSGFGRGEDETESKYRHVDIFSTDRATDIAGSVRDSVNGSVASNRGALDPGLLNATYCPFLDYNINSELKKFGLHNGGDQDASLLNEKWESLALVPIAEAGSNISSEYFLFSMSDNDFMTQDGTICFFIELPIG